MRVCVSNVSFPCIFVHSSELIIGLSGAFVSFLNCLQIRAKPSMLTKWKQKISSWPVMILGRKTEFDCLRYTYIGELNRKILKRNHSEVKTCSSEVKVKSREKNCYYKNTSDWSHTVSNEWVCITVNNLSGDRLETDSTWFCTRISRINSWRDVWMSTTCIFLAFDMMSAVTGWWLEPSKLRKMLYWLIRSNLTVVRPWTRTNFLYVLMINPFLCHVSQVPISDYLRLGKGLVTQKPKGINIYYSIQTYMELGLRMKWPKPKSFRNSGWLSRIHFVLKQNIWRK